MYKTYKFRIYPNPSQKAIIHQTFGNLRFVYNYYVTKIQTQGYQTISQNYKDYLENLAPQYDFLNLTNQYLVRKILNILDHNYKKTLSQNNQPLKYKTKYGKNSYTIPATYTYNKTLKQKEYTTKLNLTNHTLELPSIGSLKIKGYKKQTKIDGDMININITKEKNSKYYVKILYNITPLPKCKPKTIIGLDIGIKNLVSTSNATYYQNNKYIKKYEDRINKEKFKLSKKQKGSKNYYKNITKINILYTKLQNARECHIHKITKQIIDNYDIIVTENLNIKNMIMNKENNLSKSINDASFKKIITQLEYKSKEKGKHFYKIDTYYPSSQICSICETRSIKYKNLSERIYECKHCYNTLDRDINASINIMFEGLKLYMKNMKTSFL